MKQEFEALAELMMKFNEEQLVEAIPLFSRMVSALAAEIRHAESHQSAEISFDLLRVVSVPVAKLSNVYKRELPSELMAVLKVEGFLYPDQNGEYKQSRERLYELIKRGDVFKS